MPPLPPLNALRAFEVAARHLNFRLAAEDLGVTQGAVAQQVRHLEAHLGLQLFQRTGRSLVLTEAGRGYAANLRRAFDLMAEATATLRPEPAKVTISVTPTFATRWLIPRLGAFTEAHPAIDLAILASDRMANFQSDGVDLAVRLGRPPFGPGLLAEPLFEQVLIAVAAPGAPRTRLHDAHDHWPQFLALGGEDEAPPDRNLRFNQTAFAIEAALAGQGIALVPSFYVADDLTAGRLIQPMGQSLRTGADFHLVSPRKPPRPPGPVAVLRDWLRAAARESSPAGG
jgi:LysR family glycine cleavage system transcriptional activator